MPRTRIKICGITRPEDAALAAELGTDYIGLNFLTGILSGPRKITFESAQRIIQILPPSANPIGLIWMDGRHLLDSAVRGDPAGCLKRITTLQLYGLEHEILSFGFARPSGPVVENPNLWLPQKVFERASFSEMVRTLDAIRIRPAVVVLDTGSPDKLGGTGQSFNWHWIAEARDAGELEGLPPIILAGGLTPDNVAEAIRIARPYAVDVSSGVEVPSKPGIKDPIKMRDFIQAAQGA